MPPKKGYANNEIATIVFDTLIPLPRKQLLRMKFNTLGFQRRNSGRQGIGIIETGKPYIAIRVIFVFLGQSIAFML